MNFLERIFAEGKRTINRYTSDKTFLNAASAAAAMVIAADGVIDDTEITAALKDMLSNAILKDSFTPNEIEAALNDALGNTKTRVGKVQNVRAVEAMVGRAVEQRQDIFFIAADVADDGGIADVEMTQLQALAKMLGNLDAKKLLAL